MSGLQVVYEVEQFSSLFFFLGNYAIELMELKLFFAKKMAVYAARKKNIGPRKITVNVFQDK